MPIVKACPTGAESELAYCLRSYKGNLALTIGGAVISPQVDARAAEKQAVRWATKVGEKYIRETKTSVEAVTEVELRGAGVGNNARALAKVFSKAQLRIVDPTPGITEVVKAYGGEFPDAVWNTRPWGHTASVHQMLRTSPNSATLLNRNCANLAMYDGANAEAAIRTLRGDALLTNPPEQRVLSNRTLKLLKALVDGAPVGLAQDLADVYGGRPFVVCAPGEALDPAAVKRLQAGGAVVLASWQAVEKLNAGGVVPNIAVCLDPSYLLLTKYKGGKAQCLLCDTMAVQDFWKLGMPTYLFNVRSAHLHQNLWSAMKWFTLSDQSQTVSEASVWLALLLGASSLVVMGADYACHLPEAQAKAIGNTLPCVGVENGRQWFTQWHYWGACKHMIQLAMSLTHGKASPLMNTPDGQVGAYFVAGGLFSHLAKLWGLVLPILPNCDALGVSEGSVAPAAPAARPLTAAHPEAVEAAKGLLKFAATATPTCFADKSVLSKTLHADFDTPTQADRERLVSSPPSA